MLSGTGTVCPRARRGMVVGKTSMKIAGRRSMGWNSGLERLIDRVKIHVDHPLPAVVGVANQPLAPGINHEIEQLQGDHTDENRAIIIELRNFDDAFASLDGQPRWPVDSERDRVGGCLCERRSKFTKSELVDHMFWHCKIRGACVNSRVFNLDSTHLFVGQ